MTPGRLREQLRVYAELRRAVGIPLGRNVLVLGDFVDYVDQHCDADPVTTQLALDWVDDWSGKHKLAYPGTLLTIVRQFLMYVSSAIEGTEVPDIGLLGAKKRGKPFVFTADEIAAMMQTAELFGSPGSFFSCDAESHSWSDGFDRAAGIGSIKPQPGTRYAENEPGRSADP